MKTGFDDDFGWADGERVPVEDFNYDAIDGEPEGEDGDGEARDYSALCELANRLLSFVLADDNAAKIRERVTLVAALLSPSTIGHPNLDELGKLIGCSKATAHRKLSAARAALLSGNETQKLKFPRKKRNLS